MMAKNACTSFKAWIVEVIMPLCLMKTPKAAEV
jgi:hypothetical protein